MGLPLLARRWFHLISVAAFWMAYVLTRPFGASFAGWFGKLPDEGGLGLGMGPVTIVTTVVIVALVAYLATTRRDVQPAALQAMIHQPAEASSISQHPDGQQSSTGSNRVSNSSKLARCSGVSAANDCSTTSSTMAEPAARMRAPSSVSR